MTMKLWKLPNISPVNQRPIDAFAFELSRFRHDEEARRQTNVRNFYAHADVIRHRYLDDTSRVDVFAPVLHHLGPAIKDIAAHRLAIAFLPMMKSLDTIQQKITQIIEIAGSRADYDVYGGGYVKESRRTYPTDGGYG